MAPKPKITDMKQRARLAIDKLRRRGIDCFLVTSDGQVECQLCRVELAYRDADTFK